MTLSSITEIDLDGHSLTLDDLVRVGHAGEENNDFVVRVTDEAFERIASGRKVIDSVLARKETVYGINTGFGQFANVCIDDDQLDQLQVNLIRSHAAGVGQPLSISLTRMMMALRINVIAKGHSGARVETVRAYLAALNANCLPLVPCQGTVGASGDLAPLSHLALGMMGEGQMWCPTEKKFAPAGQVLERHNLSPITLKAKEGLALINGTQLIVAHGAEAAVRAKRAALTADVIAALTLEALKGTHRAFHPRIHEARGHPGQIAVASRLRDLLHTEAHPSEIRHSHEHCDRVQDSYTLRCVPQIHGVVHETVEWVQQILGREANAATDNPMIFADLQSLDWPPPQEPHCDDEVGGTSRTTIANAVHASGTIISGGNFHGEYPAKALDFLAIGVHELANVSERRIERLVNPDLSGLPAFLVEKGGLNSGFMIAHCTAAALVSENKVLCHPSSVDSISTSAAKEDHVSMGGFSARKALQVVEHVEQVLAIELLCACQAIDFHRPLKSTPAIEAMHALVRQHIEHWSEDRYMKPDIDQATELVRSGQIWEAARAFIINAHDNQ